MYLKAEPEWNAENENLAFKTRMLKGKKAFKINLRFMLLKTIKAKCIHQIFPGSNFRT